MADAGVPLHVLQEILGHQSLETTRGYLHADYRHLAAAASLGSAFLADQSPASPQPVGPRDDAAIGAMNAKSPSPAETGEGRRVGMTGFEPATP